MPIPRILHFTLPKVATSRQLETIEVATLLHPEWEVRVWRDPLPPEKFKLSRYWVKTNSGAQLADLVRIEVVLQYGGIYLDSDVRLHKRLDDLARSYDFFVASENGWALTNAVFGATAGHIALAAMVHDLDAHTPDWTLPPNVTTGPALFSRVLRGRNDVTVLPRETFYPYNCDEAPVPPHPLGYGVHLWDASWRAEYDERSKRRPGIRRLGRSVIKAPSLLGMKALRKLRAIADAVNVAGRMEQDSQRNATPVDAPALSATNRIDTLPADQTHPSELREAAFMRRILRGGDYFIDAADGSGTASEIAATLVGPFGRVVVIGPDGSPLNPFARSASAIAAQQAGAGEVAVEERDAAADTLDGYFPCGVQPRYM